jgi:hypothetical protein
MDAYFLAKKKEKEKEEDWLCLIKVSYDHQ